MAHYRNLSYLFFDQHERFEKIQSPGEEALDSGIYRCEGCGDEIGIAKGHVLPPQNYHQHDPASGPIKWRLIVCAVSS